MSTHLRTCQTCGRSGRPTATSARAAGVPALGARRLRGEATTPSRICRRCRHPRRPLRPPTIPRPCRDFRSCDRGMPASQRWSSRCARPTMRRGATSRSTRPCVPVRPCGCWRGAQPERHRSTTIELAVPGLPEHWWSILPETIYLVPFGSGGTYEQEVEVHLHPPRTAEAAARVWSSPWSPTRARSGKPRPARPSRSRSSRTPNITTAVRPRRARARRRAAFSVIVSNRGNGPASVGLAARDHENVLRFEFNRPVHEVPPGAELVTRMWASVDAADLARHRRGSLRSRCRRSPARTKSRPWRRPARSASDHGSPTPNWAASGCSRSWRSSSCSRCSLVGVQHPTAPLQSNRLGRSRVEMGVDLSAILRSRCGKSVMSAEKAEEK